MTTPDTLPSDGSETAIAGAKLVRLEGPPDFTVANQPAFIAHMNTLQGIVTRLAGNSSSCKTWCLGLVTAMLSLAGSAHAPDLLPLALVPVVVFAFLDINYLSMEKWFRDQYVELSGRAREGDYRQKDMFAIRKRSWRDAGNCFFSALFSWSVLPVYGGLVAAYWLGHDILVQQLVAAACAHS